MYLLVEFTFSGFLEKDAVLEGSYTLFKTTLNSVTEMDFFTDSHKLEITEACKVLTSEEAKTSVTDYARFLCVETLTCGLKAEQLYPRPQAFEQIWSDFHVLCLKSEPESKFKSLCDHLGVNLSPEAFVLLHPTVMTEIIKHLMKQSFQMASGGKSIQTLDTKLSKNEETVLHHVAGYVISRLRRHFHRYPNNLVAQASLKIIHTWKVPNSAGSNGSFQEYTAWTTTLNRGGLFMVEDDVFHLFHSMESAVKKTLRQDNLLK